jgi:hypothetical protein
MFRKIGLCSKSVAVLNLPVHDAGGLLPGLSRFAASKHDLGLNPIFTISIQSGSASEAYAY